MARSHLSLVSALHTDLLSTGQPFHYASNKRLCIWVEQVEKQAAILFTPRAFYI